MTAPYYQYVIVGSGVAASTIAKRLLEKDHGTPMLMLEAGPEIPAKNRRFWWDYVVRDDLPYAYTYDQEGENRSVGNANWKFAGLRVTAYGGTTLHWGGWCLRFKPEDFELFSRTGEGGDWPIGYDDLENYYCEAERHLSVCGDDVESWTRRSCPYPMPPYPWLPADLEMIDAFKECGIKPGKMPLARYRKCMTTGTCRYCPFGARFSGQYVLDELRGDARNTEFEVRCNSPVIRIDVESKQRISTIEYLDTKTGDNKKIGAKIFIICAGAFESPKLLMRSVSGHWEHGIGNDYDLVGRYLVAHSFLSVEGISKRNDERWIQEFDFPTLMSRSYDIPEFQKGGKIFLFRNYNMPNVDLVGLMQQGKTRSEIDNIVRGPRQASLSAFFEEKGRHENRLTLLNKTNRFGLPLMEVDFNRTERVYEDAKERLKQMANVFGQMNAYKITRQEFEDPAGFHASGTCRMGRSPENSVTDANLKVHGTENLYVCSNAVFPSIGAVNPTLTLTALSMRLADHLMMRS